MAARMAAHGAMGPAADAPAGREQSWWLVNALEGPGTGHRNRSRGDPATGPGRGDAAGEQGPWEVKSYTEKEPQGQPTVFQGQAMQLYVFYSI